MKSLALAILFFACTVASAQQVPMKVKVEKDQTLKLLPYLPVEIKVKLVDGSAVPANSEAIHCQMRPAKMAEVNSKAYYVTRLECGPYKFEVQSWILTVSK